MSLSFDALPEFAGLEPETVRQLKQYSRKFEVPKGSVVFQPGKACAEFLWLLSGSLRVQMVSSSGREIVLYRVRPGDSCIMTTACLLSGEHYNAEAIAEEPLIGFAISRSLFTQLLADSSMFRELVFQSFGNRIGELLQYIEAITFGRLDQRLAAFLCDNARDNQLVITHEALARELATHREVVSRMLKEIERKGLISLGHGKITLLDKAAIKSITRG